MRLTRKKLGRHASFYASLCPVDLIGHRGNKAERSGIGIFARRRRITYRFRATQSRSIKSWNDFISDFEIHMEGEPCIESNLLWW